MEAERSPWALRLGMGAIALAVVGGAAAITVSNVAGAYGAAALLAAAAVLQARSEIAAMRSGNGG